ncbi:MAG: SH3 domain-containing protein [Bacteriovoracaceae bacterium]|nr:SH3 domain-containing protein [Bacteriovoracaceae bacterium]
MAKSKADQILKEAQQFYVNKDYESALSVILKGKESISPGLFHYNLGSIYLKMGDLGPSRLHLEKAKSHGFQYPMLWKNLKYIKTQNQVYDPTKSKIFKEAFIGKVLDIPDVLIMMVTLALIIFLLGIFRKGWIRSKKYLALALVLIIVPLTSSYLIKRNFNYAVVLKPLRIYEGPSKIYPDFGEVSPGSRVVVGQLRDNWYFVISPSDISGWVEKANLAFY